MPSTFDTPRIVTWAELQQVLLPHIQGYPWAMGTLRDLWRTCTPTPDTIITPDPLPGEKRIIHPGQFKKWWADVCQRQGLNVTPNQAIPNLRTH